MSRRGVLAAAGVGVAMLIGGVMSQATSPASSSHALSAETSSPAPSTAARAVATAEGPASTSDPAPSAAAVLPATPILSMSCPGAGAGAAPTFGHQITAASPYTVVIDYGDGDRYTNDDQHLGAIFSHRYLRAGTFTVGAVLTDATGQTSTATCAYRWAAPAPVHASVPAPHSSSTGSGSGDSYVNVDGNTIHSPVTASSAPAGATAKCNDGTWSFSQHRSGTCSHHGGVAEWL